MTASTEQHNLEEVKRISNKVIDLLGTTDINIALGVFCNLLGQLLAATSEGKPSAIKHDADVMMENIKQAAIAKLLHDDTKRREKESGK